jgi:hypothetical protein
MTNNISKYEEKKKQQSKKNTANPTKNEKVSTIDKSHKGVGLGKSYTIGASDMRNYKNEERDANDILEELEL